LKPLRFIVIGCGHMGRRHVETVLALARVDPAVSLVGVADIDVQAARSLATGHAIRAVREARELFSEADAAIVAVPTVDHLAVVKAALEANLDVLVEKPIAVTVAQGEDLVLAARKRGRMLQVGHQEWFNPALRAVRELIRAPRFVEAHRLSFFSDRGTDVDVVRDLMIHDLDILQQLLGAAPTSIDAIGTPVITSRLDIANARLVFADGCIANLTASRVSVTPMRKIRFFQRDGYFSIDFLSQSVTIFRRLVGEGVETPRVETEQLKIDADDALVAQLRAFVDATRSRCVNGADASHALGALNTAIRVIDAMPSLEDLQ
jgi:predicted dehydrogenase